MSRAEGLIAASEVSEASSPVEQAKQKKRTLRGRCALVLLLAMTLAGYGAMIYFGQALLMK